VYLIVRNKDIPEGTPAHHKVGSSVAFRPIFPAYIYQVEEMLVWLTIGHKELLWSHKKDPVLPGLNVFSDFNYLNYPWSNNLYLLSQNLLLSTISCLELPLTSYLSLNLPFSVCFSLRLLDLLCSKNTWNHVLIKGKMRKRPLRTKL